MNQESIQPGAPSAAEGIYEGGILFDGCDYRTSTGIVAHSFSQGRLAWLRKKSGYYVVEFLTKHDSPTFSLPVWDAGRDQIICGSEEEAYPLMLNFTSSL